ncbi:hypothetical protein BC833DRAFT_611152 [Globomyces pollinis-pini]|nr:hypothetical protein BC833DRAFT_611152 [Globomyces pollinis-pini]
MFEYEPERYEANRLSPTVATVVTFVTVVYNIGMILNGILIYIFIKTKNHTTTIHDYAVFLLICCVFGWSSVYGILFIYMLHNGYQFTYNQCQYFGPGLPFFIASTLFSHALLAIDRYYCIIRETNIPKHKLITMFMIFIPLITITSICPLFIGSGFVLNADFYCFFNFDSHLKVDLIPSAIALLYTCLIYFIIFYCYFQIYWGVKIKTVKIASDNETLQRMNQTLFMICLVILGMFTVCYTPIVVTYFMETITGNQVPLSIQLGFTTLGISDTILTPSIVFRLCPKYQVGFKKLIFNYDRFIRNTNDHDLIKKNSCKIAKPTVKSFDYDFKE